MIPASGTLAFSTIRANYAGLINFGGFAWGTNDANLFNLGYYRGRQHRNGNNLLAVFPNTNIGFGNFYNTSGDCQCDCACDCPGVCFPSDAIVTMADGHLKLIENILVGDKVRGGYGHINTVLGYHKIHMGKSPMYIINGVHRTSGEHKHYTTAGWAGIDLVLSTTPTLIEIIIDNNNNTGMRHNPKFVNGTPTLQLQEGMTLVKDYGEELITSIEVDTSFSPTDIVYTLVTDGSHTHICNGFIVGAWVTDIDFDYSTWKSTCVDSFTGSSE